MIAGSTGAFPRPVERFRSIARAGDPPTFETVVLETAGTMRRPRVPAIPLRIRMSHLLGRAFVHDIAIGIGPFAVPFGIDTYIDGHGLVRIGRSIQTGPEIDQGALIAMWGEAMWFPSAWEDRPDVRWEPLGDGAADLVVPGPEVEIPITVRFDRATGMPSSCEADRYKAGVGKVRWRGSLGDWRRFPDGVVAPCAMSVEWADEPAPWLTLRVESLSAGAPIDAAMQRAVRRLGAQDHQRARPERDVR